MSSTNRSNAREKHIADYYITPVIEIEKFLKELNIVYGEILNTGFILDPCAGGDEKTNMSYPEALKLYNENITTIDIRENSKAEIKGDYRLIDCKNEYDIIITNPPFNIAIEIIKKALDDVKDGGIVVMLEKVTFYGSKDRFPFWQEYPPEYSFIHHKRMSFNGKGTDSVEYCHMVWRKGYKPEYTKQRII